MTAVCTPDSKNFYALLDLVHSLVHVMLRGREKNATNTVYFDLVSERAGIGILRDEFEGSPKFLLEEGRSLSPITPPLSRFLANLIRGESSGFYEHDRYSIRFVELGEQLLGVDEFAAICLRDRFAQLTLLCRREAEGFVCLITENGDPLAFLERLPFDHDLAIRDRSCDDFHDASLLRAKVSGTCVSSSSASAARSELARAI